MTEQSVFYLVYNPEGKNPQYRHPSLKSATAEAERLAAIAPGARFYVLQAFSVSVRRAVDTTILQCELDDQIPF